MTNFEGNAGSRVTSRDLYFREFDAAMRLTNSGEAGPQLEKHLSRLEVYGKDAGLSHTDISYRKQTLLYNLTQGIRNS